MNFTEVVAIVKDMTGRPDKDIEIRNSINAVINMAVMKATFTRDLVEVTTLIKPEEEGKYTGVIDLNIYTNFRKIKYIRPTTQSKYLLAKQPEGVFVNQTLLRDTYWIGGTNLNWVISVVTPSFEIGYYVYPGILSDANPNHWLLDVSPYCIIDFVVARTFKQIGDNASAGVYEQSGAQLYITMRNDMEDSVLPQAQA